LPVVNGDGGDVVAEPVGENIHEWTIFSLNVGARGWLPVVSF
jgi:hypothetical protein